jgi:hypothetical protein
MKWAVLLLLLLVACTGFGPVRKDITTDSPARVGKQGLDVNYKVFPTEVYEESNFRLTLEMENKGAQDISQGVFSLSGDEEFISLLGLTQGTFFLKGSEYGPGQKQIFQFDGKTKPLSGYREDPSATIRFYACYDYQTQATANVCMDTDLMDTTEKPCQTSTVRMSGGQGGPVAITSVKTDMTRHPTQKEYLVPEFTIKFDNAGKGLLMAEGSAITMCQGYTPYAEDLNTIRIDAMLADQSLQCNRGIVNIKNVPEVKCKLVEGIHESAGTYVTQLAVHANYGYVDSVVRSFRVKQQ